MSSYDPRKPIIKAKDVEMDEVQGHVFHARGPEQEALEYPRFETEGAAGDAEVEGHVRGRLTDTETPVEWPRFETEDEDDDPEVDGHLKHVR